MHIYNVTINIEEEIHASWLHWMKTEHIPAMLATGKFRKAVLCKVLMNEETGGITYAVQYTTDSLETLQKYYAEDAEALRSQSRLFEGKFVAFRTELEVIAEL